MQIASFLGAWFSRRYDKIMSLAKIPISHTERKAHLPEGGLGSGPNHREIELEK